MRYGYVYDSLNQLVRVNDAVAQKTYVYTYDNSGNILTKTEYPYSIGELGTANNTVNYIYDSVWNDKLMSYGNTAITYDNIGNPTAIGNKSFTWSGRQLETYTEGNKTIEFSYDENGLRHRKTVKENNVVIEQYDYVWSDGKLVSQTYITFNSGVVATTNAAKFIYSDLGELQGFILNNSATYLYTKNLQGDITSIVNESGNTILNYTYDAWGKVGFVATSMNNMLLAYTLSYVSPFTYRGYCYDYDIELYYLQSRYYDANVGRFINTDDTQIAVSTQGEVLGANLFAYCNNNPVMNVDYNGLWKKSFSTEWIAYPIDIILTAICPSFSWPYDIIGSTTRYMVRKLGYRNVAKYLLTTVVPKFRGLFSKGFTFIRKAIWRLTGSFISNITTGAIAKVFDYFINILKRPWLSQLYYCISSFFSAGAFVAGFLDFQTDGVFNGKIVLRG